jgi:hypothetical protein
MDLFTKDQIDTFLPRTAVWFKGFASPDDPSDTVKQFSRLSKRKKLLALIFLTDPENDRLPDLLQRFYPHAGTFAWYALNWVLLDKQRISKLLANLHINSDAAAAIEMAVASGRCVDEISPILDRATCQKASLAIAQHGSLKQRISLVERMSVEDATALVCGSDSSILERCIDWARRVDSMSG